MAKSKLLEKLTGGDLRSTGKSNLVVNLVLKNNDLLPELIKGLFCDEPLIRMRSADALEKICQADPSLLLPHKKVLLTKALSINQQEVKWHIAQILGVISLTKKERTQAIPTLTQWIKKTEKSKIVRVSALQTLTNFIITDPSLKPVLLPQIKGELKNSVGAIASRGKKILKQLKDLGL